MKVLNGDLSQFYLTKIKTANRNDRYVAGIAPTSAASFIDFTFPARSPPVPPYQTSLSTIEVYTLIRIEWGGVNRKGECNDVYVSIVRLESSVRTNTWIIILNHRSHVWNPLLNPKETWHPLSTHLHCHRSTGRKEN